MGDEIQHLHGVFFLQHFGVFSMNLQKCSGNCLPFSFDVLLSLFSVTFLLVVRTSSLPYNESCGSAISQVTEVILIIFASLIE